MNNVEKIAAFIMSRYGYDSFTTVQLYNNADELEMSRGSIGSALNTLKKKGYLINGNPRPTRNKRIQKTWRMVSNYPIK